MTEKTANPRGRPTTNRIDPIPASAEDIAKAIFCAADKKLKPAKPKGKRKPN
jgi:hypothetical protein